MGVMQTTFGRRMRAGFTYAYSQTRNLKADLLVYLPCMFHFILSEGCCHMSQESLESFPCNSKTSLCTATVTVKPAEQVESIWNNLGGEIPQIISLATCIRNFTSQIHWGFECFICVQETPIPKKITLGQTVSEDNHPQTQALGPPGEFCKPTNAWSPLSTY